jgi:hypothetical protein
MVRATTAVSSGRSSVRFCVDSASASTAPATDCRRSGRGRAGLRREEVSYLSGVSVTWYTWLEQGATSTPRGRS